MYKQILNEIQSPYYQQNYENDGQRFVAWYVQNIHLRDEIGTKDDVTDGPDDKQIDAIVVDDDSATIYVIQGKFIQSNSVDAEPLREVLSSWLQFHNLVKLQEISNNKLKRRLPEVATALEDEYSVSFELIVTGELTPAAKEDLAIFQQKLADSDEFPAELHLIDLEELKRRYDIALERDHPLVNHEIQLEKDKHMTMYVGNTKCTVAALSLKECIKLPGIRDGTLFQKNVRQSLGLNNRVNKGIKETIYGTENSDFFFRHNGITALCTRTSIKNDVLSVQGLNVVNGCQSLSTMLSCSERVRELSSAYVMLRFYEIAERDRSDRISISTNSQSAVKPRDLRSNDRRILALKKSYEQKYNRGYFITKRGEEAPADRDQNYVVDLLQLGKWLIAWQSQRPNVSYSETKIFDKHFDQLFRRNEDYDVSNIEALHQWMIEIYGRWVKENPLGLNESLLAMKAYAPYHHLYAISCFFSVLNAVGARVPIPAIAFAKAKAADVVTQLVDSAGTCLNSALEAAANEPQLGNRVFSPQNWIKTKACLAAIKQATTTHLNVLRTLPEAKSLFSKFNTELRMDRDDFVDRWAAD